MSTFCYNKPLIKYLNENESLDYYLFHQTKGYRIIEPSGKEHTPHHTSSEGHRCLLVTDQRVLYVVGRESGDKTIEYIYDEIKAVDAKQQRIFRFQTNDGVVYKFATNVQSTEGVVHYFIQRDQSIEKGIGSSIGEAIKSMGKQVTQSRGNGNTAEESGSKPADKLRELKELHEEGILTDNEFESKKEELLDDF